MIDSISISNFKSFKNAELRFSPLTLLIGPNASGKSNAIEAIRLLSWLAKGQRLDDIERNIHGADSLVRGQARDLFQKPYSLTPSTRQNESYTINPITEIRCKISEKRNNWNFLSLNIGLINDHLIVYDEKISDLEDKNLYEISTEPIPHTNEVWVRYNNFMMEEEESLIPCSNQQAIFYQLETPGRFKDSHEESQKIIPFVTKSFREALRSIVFIDPQPSLMRNYTHVRNDEITEDCSNISSVINTITKSEKNSIFLLDFIRSLPEQDIETIGFIETDRNDVMVRLVESFGGKENIIDAPLLSDGTLRVLAVAAVLLTAPEGSLVIIEEIDNGIHPSRADLLISNIKETAERRNLRVLLTSHNPALLDALPDESLGDVLCCYRDPGEGDSRIVQLKTLERYPALVARGPLGYLMTNGILDRFLKDKTTPEQRKNASLQWLKNLKSEVSG